MDTVRVAVVMAVRNRRERTRACLDAISALDLPGVAWHAYVLDDGSSDGTAEMLRERVEVTCLRGSGDCYWGGGMRAAEVAALADGPDYVLWLNDDAELYDDALERALMLVRQHGDSTIVCGAMQDTASGDVTYSGVRRRLRPFLVLTRVDPHPHAAVAVDSVNGNFVLVPAGIARELGGIDGRFTHHYGDFDYGLRARRRGHEVVLMPGYAGRTARNAARGTFRDPRLPRPQRYQDYLGPKGYPLDERWSFLVRHAGAAGALQFVAVNVIHLTRILVGR